MTCLTCGRIYDPKDLDRIGAKYEVTEDGWMICPICQSNIEKMDKHVMLIDLVSTPLKLRGENNGAKVLQDS